jgi:hypothetical protein
VISDASYDFGAVAEGTRVKHDFTIENQGTGDLAIEQIVPGCGCTAAAAGASLIKPGEKTVLHIEFDSTGFVGEKSKGTRINTNDPETPSSFVTVKGIVEPDLKVEPKRINFGEISRSGDTSPVRVTVSSLRGAPVGAISTLSKAIEVSNISGSDTEKSFSVRLSPKAQLGELRDRVGVVLGNGAAARQISIPVTGTVMGAIQVRPAQVAFGILEGDTPLERSVKVENAGSTPVELRDIQTDNPAVQVEKKVMQAGKVWVLKIKVDPAKVRKALNATVTLHTTHPTESEVAFLVYGVTPNGQ